MPRRCPLFAWKIFLFFIQLITFRNVNLIIKIPCLRYTKKLWLTITFIIRFVVILHFTIHTVKHRYNRQADTLVEKTKDAHISQMCRCSLQRGLPVFYMCVGKNSQSTEKSTNTPFMEIVPRLAGINSNKAWELYTRMTCRVNKLVDGLSI